MLFLGQNPRFTPTRDTLTLATVTITQSQSHSHSHTVTVTVTVTVKDLSKNGGQEVLESCVEAVWAEAHVGIPSEFGSREGPEG